MARLCRRPVLLESDGIAGRLPAFDHEPGDGRVARMSRSDRDLEEPGTPYRRAVLLTAILSIVATLIAGAALAVVLVRGSNQPAAQAEATACGTVTWYAIPERQRAPVGLGDRLDTFPRRRPDDHAGRPDAVRRDAGTHRVRRASVATGPTRRGSSPATTIRPSVPAPRTWTVTPLGDETAAVTSPRLGSTTDDLHPAGNIVADITAPTTLDTHGASVGGRGRRRGDEPGLLREPGTFVDDRGAGWVGVFGPHRLDRAEPDPERRPQPEPGSREPCRSPTSRRSCPGQSMALR